MTTRRGLAGCALLLAACDLTVHPTPEETTIPLPTPPADERIADATCSNGRIELVAWGIDGDTIALTNLVYGENEDVRLIGIDTSEYYSENGPECYATESKAQTATLVDNQTICLTYDPAVAAEDGNIDYYGRTLAYVFFGEDFSRFLNAELLSGGFAEDYPFTDGAVFEEYFYDLEAYAQKLGLGRWTACGDAEKH